MDVQPRLKVGLGIGASMKAFSVVWIEMVMDEGIYWAETAGKAKYRAYLQAKDAGYDLSITELIACRRPGFDDHPQAGDRGISLEYLS